MINQFLGIFSVIGKQNRIKGFFLLIILLIVIFLELLNFSLIIPILTLIFNNESGNYKFLDLIHDNFGLDVRNVLILGIIFILILILKILLLLFFEYKIQKFSREINVDISLKAYSYFLHSSWQEIFQKDHAYIMRNIMSDTSTFVQQGIMKIIELFKNSFLLIFIISYLFFINFKSTFVILVVLTFFVLIFYIFFRKKFLELSEKTAILEKFRFKNVSESIMNLRDIKLTNSAEYFLKLFESNEKEISKVVITDAIINKIPRYLLEIVIVLFALILILFFETKNLEMVELIPVLGLYAFAALRMIPIFVVYNSGLQALRIAKFQIDEVIKNTGRYSKLFREKNLKKNMINTKLKLDSKLDISINNVSFSYDNNKVVFKDVNLVLDKNCTIFIEGPNGSGKSTFVDLLSGMLKPTNGIININGINLDTISEVWKKNIGYVSQLNFLINSSIRDNIIFGRRDISDNDVENVLKIVGLDALINELPDKLETNVGSLGTSLSGGQKQKISIARALVGDPKVIILDEATNALDIEGEKKFLDIINKIKKNKITIFIAHSKIIKDFCDINFLIREKRIVQIKK